MTGGRCESRAGYYLSSFGDGAAFVMPRKRGDFVAKRTENLKPQSKRTKAEQREIASKGGKAPAIRPGLFDLAYASVASPQPPQEVIRPFFRSGPATSISLPQSHVQRHTLTFLRFPASSITVR